MAGRPSREAVARWNLAYAEQTTALFAAMRSGDPAAVRRLAGAYYAVAQAWRVLSADFDAPLWARHAASVAAEEFELRARVETLRAVIAEP
ncbi:hypothetical protein [Amycolatopsis aidingensis]|uniref:hypothetical protein n=1 Tax=Amycolatopsis aidingensis TaxID=2842453 RepID=UPI001C0CA453|nr:hypothetical protein [Amycolatopsis aidingensis]